MIDSGRVKKHKDVTANKKLKKSNSVGLEAAANEDTFQSLFIDSKEESQIKKRGRPKKNSINPLNQTFVQTALLTKTQPSLSKKKSLSIDKGKKALQSTLSHPTAS